MMTDKNEDVKLSTTDAPEVKPELTDEEIASVAGGISTSTGGPHGKTNTVPVTTSPVKSPIKA